jgi:hypothetical protein
MDLKMVIAKGGKMSKDNTLTAHTHPTQHSLNTEGTIIEEAITQDLRKADELHIKNNYK